MQEHLIEMESTMSEFTEYTWWRGVDGVNVNRGSNESGKSPRMVPSSCRHVTAENKAWMSFMSISIGNTRH